MATLDFCKQQLIFNLSKPIRARANLVLSGYVMHLSFWFTNRPSKRSEFSNFIVTDAVNSVDYYQWVVRKKFEQVEINLYFLQFEQFIVKSLLWQLIDGDLDQLRLAILQTNEYIFHLNSFVDMMLKCKISWNQKWEITTKLWDNAARYFSAKRKIKAHISIVRRKICLEKMFLLKLFLIIIDGMT